MLTAKDVAKRIMARITVDNPTDGQMLQIVHATGPFRRVVCNDLAPADLVTLCVAVLES